MTPVFLTGLKKWTGFLLLLFVFLSYGLNIHKIAQIIGETEGLNSS